MSSILLMIVKYWLELVVAGITTYIYAFLKKIKADSINQSKKMDALTYSSIVSLRKQIWDTYNEVMEKGYVSPGKYDIICDMYEAYKQLGGNHGVSKLIDEIKELPSIPKNTNNE